MTTTTEPIITIPLGDNYSVDEASYDTLVPDLSNGGGNKPLAKNHQTSQSKHDNNIKWPMLSVY